MIVQNIKSYLKKVDLADLALILFTVLLVLIYGYILFSYPYQEGGDLLFHTWFTNQITDNGSIPQTAPTNNTTGLYSFTPLFHILGSITSQILDVEAVYILPFFNLLLIVIFIFSLYILTNLIFKNKAIGLMAVIMFFLLSNFNFLYFLPRNLILVIFILIIYIGIKISKESTFSLSKYFLYGLLVLSLIFMHHVNALYALMIIASFLVVLLIYSPKKIKTLLLLITIPLASLIFIFINYSSFSDNAFPIDTSDASFTVGNGSAESFNDISINLFQPFASIISSIGWLFLLFGLILIIYNIFRKKTVSIANIGLLTWIITGLLILYQTSIGYDFLASRALSLLLPVFAILSAYGFYMLLSFLINDSEKTKIVSIILVLGFILIPLVTISLSDNYIPIKDGITREHLSELLAIKESIPSGTVLSDPSTMYLLTTLSNMNPAYTFEHTNLRASNFKKWQPVQNIFYSDVNDTIKNINSLNPDYIIISDRTKLYLNDADFNKFNDEQYFTKIYETASEMQSNNTETNIIKYPGYSVYQVVPEK